MARRTAAVLFDFDYTLVDSSAGCIDAANSALVALGLPQAEPDASATASGSRSPIHFAP